MNVEKTYVMYDLSEKKEKTTDVIDKSRPDWNLDSNVPGCNRVDGCVTRDRALDRD